MPERPPSVPLVSSEPGCLARDLNGWRLQLFACGPYRAPVWLLRVAKEATSYLLKSTVTPSDVWPATIFRCATLSPPHPSTYPNARSTLWTVCYLWLLKLPLDPYTASALHLLWLLCGPQVPDLLVASRQSYCHCPTNAQR